MKTDINGEPLWEKVFGDYSSTMVIRNQRQDKEGNIYISGGTTYFNSDDPYLIKLNECGELQWGTVFHTPGNYDFASRLELLPGGDCLITLRYHGYDIVNERICMARLDSNGNILWKNFYAQNDPRIYAEDDQCITLLPNDRILLTGYCYYKSMRSTISYLKTLHICTDYDGEIVWEKVLDGDVLDEDGKLHLSLHSEVSHDGKYIYSGLERRYPSTGEKRPAFVKLDMDGNQIAAYDLIEGFDFGMIGQFKFVNDSLMIGSGGWGYFDDKIPATDIPNKQEYKKETNENLFTCYEKDSEYSLTRGIDSANAILYDTLGNIIKER